MTPTEVVRREDVGITAEAARFMPVMSMAVAESRRDMIVQAIAKLMKEGIDADYGIIPGTKKRTLLQPGAQKLDNLFGLVPKFVVEEKELDWNGDRHAGEAFFYFEIRCQLWRGEFLMGEGLGSANSWESKYRYRNSERVCPVCGKDAIIKGKTEYGGGHLCFKRKGGCGAKFADGDPAIEGQETGKKPNPDIADVVNTVMKIANKRAHVAATINATSASEFFTQDVEDQPEFSQPPPQFDEPQHQQQTRQPNGSERRPVNRTAPPAPVEDRRAPSPEVERADDKLEEMLRLMTGFEPILKVFEGLKSMLEQITGSDIRYYEILNKFGMRHANGFKTVQNARAAASTLYREIAKLNAEMPAPEEPPAPEEGA